MSGEIITPEHTVPSYCVKNFLHQGEIFSISFLLMFQISLECNTLFYLIVHLLGKNLLPQTYVRDFPTPWLSVSSVPNLAYGPVQLKALE